MRDKHNIKLILILLILTSYMISTITPMVFGLNFKVTEKDEYLENLAFVYSDRYSFSKIAYYEDLLEKNILKNVETIELITSVKPLTKIIFCGPMDSAWPMKCHNNRHTSLSPYSTIDNSYDEKWRFRSNSWIEDSIVIDNEGIIYFGSMDYYLYALHSNGTLKWKYKTGGLISSAPTIAEDGTIYIGSWDARLYAINPDGTLKWKCTTHGSIASSPAIGDDGAIYFGTLSSGNMIVAVNPNGTERWHYKTGYSVTSDPAINDDGTVFIGSGDKYLYALYPNGTLRWRFKTGDYVKGPVSIADDGTVYVGSYDGYLYALSPKNGTMKWRCGIDWGAETNPSIGDDGTIYIGGDKLYAVYPNGTMRWSFDFVGDQWVGQSSPAISSDGTIYIGTHISSGEGGVIWAVNPDGTKRWSKKIAKKWVDSSPSIDEDGTVYIGSTYDMGDGYLYAFGVGELEANVNGPYYGLINQPMQFNGSATGGYRPHSYHWDFGDTHTSEKQNPTHTYTSPGNYTITLTVTDNKSNTVIDTTFAWIQDGNTPPDAPDINGPPRGNPGISYDYKFTGTDPDGSVFYLFVDWDDGSNSGWLGPYVSGQEITLSHKWSQLGKYTIKCKAKDPYDVESSWEVFTVEIPRNRATTYLWYQWFLERFPMLERLLNLLMK